MELEQLGKTTRLRVTWGPYPSAWLPTHSKHVFSPQHSFLWLLYGTVQKTVSRMPWAEPALPCAAGVLTKWEDGLRKVDECRLCK